ncbi:hypothetical protein ACA910_019112 [Epithemia clementina (nom. ined.)]
MSLSPSSTLDSLVDSWWELVGDQYLLPDGLPNYAASRKWVLLLWTVAVTFWCLVVPTIGFLGIWEERYELEQQQQQQQQQQTAAEEDEQASEKQNSPGRRNRRGKHSKSHPNDSSPSLEPQNNDNVGAATKTTSSSSSKSSSSPSPSSSSSSSSSWSEWNVLWFATSGLLWTVVVITIGWSPNNTLAARGAFVIPSLLSPSEIHELRRHVIPATAVRNHHDDKNKNNNNNNNNNNNKLLVGIHQPPAVGFHKQRLLVKHNNDNNGNHNNKDGGGGGGGGGLYSCFLDWHQDLFTEFTPLLLQPSATSNNNNNKDTAELFRQALDEAYQSHQQQLKESPLPSATWFTGSEVVGEENVAGNVGSYSLSWKAGTDEEEEETDCTTTLVSSEEEEPQTLQPKVQDPPVATDQTTATATRDAATTNDDEL